jgi:hypothetical protein
MKYKLVILECSPYYRFTKERWVPEKDAVIGRQFREGRDPFPWHVMTVTDHVLESGK